MTDRDRLLTAEDVAELLNVRVSWVRETTRANAMPCVRLGRYVRYERTAILDWVASLRQPGRAIALRRHAPRAAAG